MRTPLVVPLAFIFTAAFANGACRSEMGTCAPVLADAPASGARVTATRATSGTESLVTVDVKPGAAAHLLLALGDRVPDLDLTPADDVSEALRKKVADAQLLFVPVAAQEAASIRVRARPWHGRDVLETFVVPFGGEEAASAVKEAAPDFAKRTMVELFVEVEVGGKTTSVRYPIVARPGEQQNVSTLFLRDDDVVPFGEPVRIEEWVMAEAATGFTPAVHQRGSKLVGGTLTNEVPVDALPAGVWTLWMQLEPAAP